MEKLPPFFMTPVQDSKQEQMEKRLADLWAAVQDLQESLVVEQKVAPAKPREGMIRWANGTTWNPGAGAGLYQYIGGAWTRLNN